jgi:hypothetical protein
MLLGKSSNPQERAKGSQVAQALDNERGGKPITVVLTEGEDKDPNMIEFYSRLGGKKPIRAADNDDEEWEKAKAPKLFRLSDATGRFSGVCVCVCV